MRTHQLIILLFFIGCKTSISTVSKEEYDEDLSIYRPIEPIDVSQIENHLSLDTIIQEVYQPTESNIKEELDQIIELATKQNKEKRYVDGYRIQIYNGINRTEAAKIKTLAADLFPELDVSLSYHQPNFRVKGGQFTQRLEAYRYHVKVKQKFPQAVLIPEKILLDYK